MLQEQLLRTVMLNPRVWVEPSIVAFERGNAYHPPISWRTSEGAFLGTFPGAFLAMPSSAVPQMPSLGAYCIACNAGWAVAPQEEGSRSWWRFASGAMSVREGYHATISSGSHRPGTSGLQCAPLPAGVLDAVDRRRRTGPLRPANCSAHCGGCTLASNKPSTKGMAWARWWSSAIRRAG